MSKERVYYRAGAQLTAHVAEVFAKDDAARKAAVTLAREYGPDVVPMANGPRVIGFNREVPGTRRNTQGTWVPRMRTPEGAALAAKLKALPEVPDLSFEILGFRVAPFDHGHMRFVQCGAYVFDDVTAIEMLAGDDPPEDCTPMKTSEFWLMREAWEARTGRKVAEEATVV